MAINNHLSLKNLTFDMDHDIKNNSSSLEEHGIGVIELILSVTLLFLTLSLSVSGFQSARDRALATDAVRTVTSVFSSARYRSLDENRMMRVRLEGNVLLLETKKIGEWSMIRQIPMKKNVGISMNASPIFYPTGFVTPLCSVVLKTLRYSYKISISIAGRIKTIKLEAS